MPDFEAAVRLAPDFSIAHRELGVAYYRLNRHDDALRALTAATKLEPRDTSSWYWRARVLVLLGRTTEALRDAERVVQLSPKWSEGWFLKGELQANLGRLDLAFDDLGRSLKLQPTHAYALARRSLLLAEVGDFKAAWTDADAAVRHSPQDASLLLDRGRIALLQGKDAAAIADMTDALSRLEDRRLKLYGALWMMIAVLRSGTELHHQPNVRAFIDDGNKTEWPAPLAWVYLAALSRAKADWKETVGDPAKYLGSAQQAATEPNQSRTEDRKCESGFFLGMYYVLTGDAVRGEDLLRQAASRRVNSWSYIGAKAELARLGQRQAGGKVR
ncbi:MAG: tetratricopeptide repeat protein [Alphaproteobacteria bacterium]|nr:tetratricopeptide repeat protein [Alphaproteobacteria bacterium]